MAGQSNQQAHMAHDPGPRAARNRAGAAARAARAVLAGCVAAFFALPAHAKYDVDIDAPRSVRKLLKSHLDIARFAKRDDISEDQFDFLVTATPQQVRDLTATAGYFSPVVRTDVRMRDGKRDVRIAVDPGPQTVVSTVDLTFKGPVDIEDPKQEAATRFAFSLKPGDPFTQS
ncbi:translocation and assembly module TamA, partial [Burkholderia sp. NFPP32]